MAYGSDGDNNSQYFKCPDKVEIWYHGSPIKLTSIREGSSITPYRDVARAFTHKPPVLSWSGPGTLQHNGTRSGYLYRVAEVITEDDIYLHPALEPYGDDWEWLIKREMAVELICETVPDPAEWLSDADIEALKNKSRGG